KAGPVEATAANKAAAGNWIERIVPEGLTNIFDALVRAFSRVGRGSAERLEPLAADTFYLLTDGHANRGEVQDPTELIEELARLNRHHRVIIHAVGLGNDADGGFLRALAERFGGRYVHIRARKPEK
ncbi:MAG: VWA domain-containing protein, partial [Planctomycetes bacterium]|nr:VWA domain-containing protein [Planctomycetota bacterium]